MFMKILAPFAVVGILAYASIGIKLTVVLFLTVFIPAFVIIEGIAYLIRKARGAAWF